MRSEALTLLCIVAAAFTAAAVADEDLDPRPIIEGRQAGLREIGAAFKGIGDELRKSAPSLPVIRQYARQIDDLARQQKFWFPPGTGPETDLETAAKPEIWRHPAQFQAVQIAMSEHAAKLVQVARGEDARAVRSQWKTLGNACKQCHERFREEEE